ncbi:hypothetical protein LV475_07195 [Guyparkeria hydrothermalis]|uniref:hypothetical protein n=1 Tax=Guyparkeria hydrothermalis TaxID=923 RepID=UPI00202155D8|nr:hypothetical protein [Guyparkeria hydrothermalis]MCL7751381.1 hypothetical protein [Guyparkeria hydrothermalis]
MTCQGVTVTGRRMGRLLTVMLCATLLTACANTTRFEAGPITAFGGEIEATDAERFYLLRIDTRELPADELPALALPLPGAERPVTLEALTPAEVARYLPRFEPPPQWPETWKARARAYPSFEGDGYFIGFGDIGLESVSLCSHCAGQRQSPSLCTADGRVCHRFPLTRDQLVALVGPPGREYKVIEVRY